MLVICKGSTQDTRPINITNRFLPSDDIMVAIAVLDNYNHQYPIDIDITWKHLATGTIVTQSLKQAIFKKDSTQHRLATYVKLNLINQRKLYGQWETTLFTNTKPVDKKMFSIIPPHTIYGPVGY
jgi:hypothetical protein